MKQPNKLIVLWLLVGRGAETFDTKKKKKTMCFVYLLQSLMKGGFWRDQDECVFSSPGTAESAGQQSQVKKKGLFCLLSTSQPYKVTE